MRILGIDLGTFSLKAVILEPVFGNLQIKEYYEYNFQQFGSLENIMIHLCGRFSSPPNRVVVALPSSVTTLRNFQFPTRNKKAIHASIGFELEDELPFPSDSLVFDYQILSQNRHGSTLHVAASLKHYIERVLQQWSKVSIYPDMITTEAWSYHLLFNRIAKKIQSDVVPILFMQMGHSKTTLFVYWKSTPLLIREIQWGGRLITESIAKHHGVSIEQAESMKLSPSLSFDIDGLLGLDIFANELKCFELTAKNIIHRNIGHFYFAGGSSLFPGWQTWFEQRLHMSVQPVMALNHLMSLSPVGSGQMPSVSYPVDVNAKFLGAVAVATSAVGSLRSTSINFRKGVWAKIDHTKKLDWKFFKKPLLVFCFLSCSLWVSLMIQSKIYQNRLKKTQVRLEVGVRTIFGDLSSSALKTYVNNTSMLRSSIQKELFKKRELFKIFSSHSSMSGLNFLNTLSEKIPKTVVVDLIQVQIGISRLESFMNEKTIPTASLTFLVKNPQMIEKLTLLLEGEFHSMKKSTVESVILLDGTTQKWKVIFSGIPREVNL